jgi:hypothetical protein
MSFWPLPHPFWHELWGWRKRRCGWCALLRNDERIRLHNEAVEALRHFPDEVESW